MASFIQMYIFYGLTYIFDEKRPRRRHGSWHVAKAHLHVQWASSLKVHKESPHLSLPHPTWNSTT